MSTINIQNSTFEYVVRLADNSLVLGHRLSEWCGKGPILEEDIALINISLDLVGRARSLYAYAATLNEKYTTEDHLAYRRDVKEYRNSLLVEQPNGDYAQTILRSYLFDVFSLLQLQQLIKSKDQTIAGVSEKSIKEVTYHLEHSRQWLYRLGDGTEESHERMEVALKNLWRFAGNLFDINEVDEYLIKEGIAFNLADLKPQWIAILEKDFALANLKLPENMFSQSGNLQGVHTEHLGYLLAEMQFLQRAYPDAVWD
jgi:ring-1,2-phenylacetyl-CoA epoxidase subunit PaaC